MPHKTNQSKRNTKKQMEEMGSLPPLYDTHPIEIYLRQVIDALHKDPCLHRARNKGESRRLKIISQHQNVYENPIVLDN